VATDRWLFFFSIFMLFHKCHIFHCASSNGVVSRKPQTRVAELLLRIRSPCFISLVTDLRAAIAQSIGRFAKSGDRILVEAKFSAPFQSGRGPPVQWVLGHFPEVKGSGRGVDHQPPSRAKAKERVELYLYSPCGLSSQCICFVWISEHSDYLFVYTKLTDWLL
jgi:hypothetical protein